MFHANRPASAVLLLTLLSSGLLGCARLHRRGFG